MELLDQSRSFTVLGPDEGIWFFKWESESSGIIQSWHVYSRKPGSDVFLPAGIWAEDSVFRFLTRHTRKLTDSDRIDLFLYLHKGGIETFLRKHRIEETDDDHSRRRHATARERSPSGDR